MTTNETKLLEIVKEVMTSLGLTKIVTTYTGSGNDGYVEPSVCYIGRKPCEVDTTHPDLAERLDNAMQDLVESKYPGYELNEGGSGKIMATMVSGKLHVVFSMTRYVMVGKTTKETVTV